VYRGRLARAQGYRGGSGVRLTVGGAGMPGGGALPPVAGRSVTAPVAASHHSGAPAAQCTRRLPPCRRTGSARGGRGADARAGAARVLAPHARPAPRAGGAPRGGDASEAYWALLERMRREYLADLEAAYEVYLAASAQHAPGSPALAHVEKLRGIRPILPRLQARTFSVAHFLLRGAGGRAARPQPGA